MQYAKYLIKDTDKFDAFHFPKISEELDVITTTMANSPTLLNSEMLLSFVKDHNMQAEWVATNPEVAEMISSKTLPLSNLEALFASSANNPIFRKQLEDYVVHRFKTSSLS